ncbi:unnamed protein product [Prorocentrum cordatum]|uniref:Uncharacterized protein n=1 Tax=Prorocentrum cordatum TaxID=2364126 RepID=A0ABN9TDF7_9DINO|nr:unnamed protein product [Polarella glacialis]
MLRVVDILVHQAANYHTYRISNGVHAGCPHECVKVQMRLLSDATLSQPINFANVQGGATHCSTAALPGASCWHQVLSAAAVLRVVAVRAARGKGRPPPARSPTQCSTSARPGALLPALRARAEHVVLATSWAVLVSVASCSTGGAEAERGTAEISRDVKTLFSSRPASSTAASSQAAPFRDRPERTWRGGPPSDACPSRGVIVIVSAWLRRIPLQAA